MTRLAFAVPAYGRFDLARICLRQLRQTCDALTAEGIDATAIVVGDDDNLTTARDLGFGTVRRANASTSRKFNDGIQFACDPRYQKRPADYVVPCGSDDWVDHRLFLTLPPADTLIGFQRMSFVNEDATEIATLILNYPGGAGIRIYPRQLLEPLGYRPADEDRRRGCDTSILVNVRREWGDDLKIDHRHVHDRQIVDWKTPGEQLNPYESLRRHRHADRNTAPFDELAGMYPEALVDAMRAHYAQARYRVAA